MSCFDFQSWPIIWVYSFFTGCKWMIESEFVVVTADMGTVSGCRFSTGFSILIFGFRGVAMGGLIQLDASLKSPSRRGGIDCILGVRCDQRNVPSTGRGILYSGGTEICHRSLWNFALRIKGCVRDTRELVGCYWPSRGGFH